jgi:hypothetical protein
MFSATMFGAPMFGAPRLKNAKSWSGVSTEPAFPELQLTLTGAQLSPKVPMLCSGRTR